MKRFTIFLGLILIITIMGFISADPCYPMNTPGCQDVCGDHTCGNSEGFDTCAGDCDHCIDENPNRDEFTKGFIVYNWNEKSEDICLKDIQWVGSNSPSYKTLSRTFCANERGPNTGGSGSRGIECEFGCENGTCLRTKPNVIPCVESDSGKDEYHKGTTRYLDIESRDMCYDPTRGNVRECGPGCELQEYYCNAGAQGLSPESKITFENIQCPIGCKDGECIKCEGCVSEGQCLKVGTIIEDTYCSPEGSFENQKDNNKECNLDYECKYKPCIHGVCNPGFFKKIALWFQRLFS